MRRAMNPRYSRDTPNAGERRRRSAALLRLVLVSGAALSVLLIRSARSAERPIDGPRQPTALVHLDDVLLVANRRSGTVTVVTTDLGRVEGELAVGEQLSDLALIPRSDLLVATDEGASQLILLRWTARRLEVLERYQVAAAPVSIAADPNGTSLTVASHWARRLSRWTIDRTSHRPRLAPAEVLDLPFAPRAQLAAPDGRNLVVADAFGPYLAIVQRESLKLQAIYQVPGHNLRGLANSADGRELLIVHQMLNPFIPTTRDHVFWGNTLTNLLRAIEWDELLTRRLEPTPASSKPVKLHGTLQPLGREGHAAGDPEAIRISSRGEILILLAGTGELALRGPDERRFARLPVGRRPTALAVSADGGTAWVANRFDDQLVAIDLDRRQIERRISVAPNSLRDLSLAERGEQQFYNATLSLDGWFSCHSCHTDGHTCGLLNDNFGDDTLGAPKRIPSLLGTASTGPWAWHGGRSTLEEQVQKSLEQTMHAGESGPLDPAVTASLAAYLRTLTPPPSIAHARGTLDAAAVARGREVFFARSCNQCHEPPEYTSAASLDVGLVDERGRRQFNPPSLRGLAHRPELLHDNRAASLQALLAIHPAEVETDAPWTGTERDDLMAFLLSL